MLRRVLLVGVLAFAAQAAICPMEKHQVCNQGSAEHKCVCAMTLEESSAPEQSCNVLIKRDEDLSFPAVSVTFDLDESHDGVEEWPEEAFIESIANIFRNVDNDDVIIFRASCNGTETSLTVQFGILKRGNESSPPYDQDDFIDVESVVNRMSNRGDLSKIADLIVNKIDAVNELVDIEYDPDNGDLIFQAVFIGVSCFLMFALGIYVGCRNRGYSDDLQKA